MPTWLTVLAGIVSSIILVMGIANFPYVPMLFGLYGGESETARGRLVYALIWLYPVVTIVCLYLAWKGPSYASIVPIGYVVVAWVLRVNKYSAQSSNKGQYKSKDENLKASLSLLELYSGDVAAGQDKKQYLFVEFFAPSGECAQALRDNITKNEKLYDPVEINQTNGAFEVVSRLLFESTEKNAIVSMVKHLVDLAWQNECELRRLSILEQKYR